MCAARRTSKEDELRLTQSSSFHLLYSFQFHDGFTMCGMTELVDSTGLRQLIFSARTEQLQITCHSRRITGYIDNSLRLFSQDCLNYGSFAALTRWVQHNNICLISFSHEFRKYILRCSSKKVRISNGISSRIFLGILNRFRNNLDAGYMPCLLRQEKRTGHRHTLYL